MDTGISNIAVLTSGGDAPGMNAAIRAVVRTGIYHGCRVYGVQQGYRGLIEGRIEEMNARSVSNTIHLGGTILKTARCLEFKTDEGMAKAYDNMQRHGIDGLVVIGGDGTFTGATRFSEKYPVRIAGIPGTIDNDLQGTDFTLGFDTALNTVMDALDKIRDTADSHDRLFFIEVMGRDSGCIALRSGVGCGAEAILMPEQRMTTEALIARLQADVVTKKTSCIIIVSEGHKTENIYDLADKVGRHFNQYETKVSILGHLQRGGSPSSFDRILGSRLGYAAVNELLKGNNRIMVGLAGNSIAATPIDEALKLTNGKLENDLLEMADILAI